MGFEISREMQEKIMNQGKLKAKKLAEDTKEELMNEAIEQVSEFYHEYSPVFYKRHNDNADETSGLGRSINPICRLDSSRTAYEGGIEISTKRMFTDYRGTPYQVLTSYLDGFHGLPTYGQYLRDVSLTDKFRYLEKYKDAIIKRFK